VVVGTADNGTEVALKPKYVATGGTVSSEGVYHAGQTPGNFRVIATDTVTNLADTSTVIIEAPPATLQAVVLTPATASLTTGAEQQFGASGKMSDGTTSGITVTWNAEGGAISSDGLYKAGQTAGTFRVIATQIGGTLADTATVTITAVAPAPPPLAPAPTETACTSGSYARVVKVASATGLTAALTNAQPGDLILLADGTYSGHFTLTRPGTAQAPITLCGSANAVLDGGSMSSGYVVYLKGARYWRLVGFSVTNGQKGIMMDGAFDNHLEHLTVHHVGSELVHFRQGSSRNTLQGSYLHHAGVVSLGHYGEGIYIGSSGATTPDTANDNQILNNRIEDVTAEAVEVKENTRRTLVDGNTILRAGKGLNADGTPSASGSIATRAGNSTFSNNTIVGCATTCPVNGIVVYSGGGAGDGDYNTFKGNTIDVESTGYGIQINTTQVGNVVGCDNVIRNAVKGFANVRCQ
jgi:hypothetical protein